LSEFVQLLHAFASFACILIEDNRDFSVPRVLLEESRRPSGVVEVSSIYLTWWSRWYI
jgi:hypothetical protein